MKTAAATKERTSVQLTEDVKAELEAAATAMGLSLPAYIRRALALTRTLDKYTDPDGTLIVVDKGDPDSSGARTEERIHIMTLV
jgi:hypothetical protein